MNICPGNLNNRKKCNVRLVYDIGVSVLECLSSTTPRILCFARP